MYVRIARFEGGDLADADKAIERVRNMTQENRPPGLEGATSSSCSSTARTAADWD